jgi:hypothetical protein
VYLHPVKDDFGRKIGNSVVKAAKTSAGSTEMSDTGAFFRAGFGDRLGHLLALFESRTSAADVAGVTPEQLGRYVSGQTTKVPIGVIVRLAAKKGISLDWLATGEGAREIGAPIGSDYLHLPVFDARASSGFGAHFNPGGEIARVAVPRLFLGGAKLQEDQLVIIFNHGRSNEPDLNDGDALIIDRSVDRIVDDAFYVFDRDGALLVKMIERDVRGGITLKSRNPAYSSAVLSKDEAAQMRVIGRVVFAAGLV